MQEILKDDWIYIKRFYTQWKQTKIWEHASETGHTTKIIDNTFTLWKQLLKINILDEIELLKKIKMDEHDNDIISNLSNPTFSIWLPF